MAVQITQGSTVRVTADFFDGIARFDPSVLTFKFMNPAGSVTTYVYGTDDNVSRLSLGRFACDAPVSTAGRWSYRIESTTAGYDGDNDGSFTVVASVFL